MKKILLVFGIIITISIFITKSKNSVKIELIEIDDVTNFPKSFEEAEQYIDSIFEREIELTF